MTIEDQDYQKLILIRIEKARDALDDARFLVSDKRLNASVNRIYYSVFYLLSALSLKHGFETSKHRQIIGWFNREFVKTGIVSAYTGAFVHNAYDKRSLGDYDDYVCFSQDEVMSMLEKAEDFLREIIILINDNSEKISSQNNPNTPLE